MGEVVFHDTPRLVVAFIPVYAQGSSVQTHRLYYTFATTDAMLSQDYTNKFQIDRSVLQVSVHQEVNGIGINSFKIELVDVQDPQTGLNWEEKIAVGDVVVIAVQREVPTTRILYTTFGDTQTPSSATLMVGVVTGISKNVVASGGESEPEVDRTIVVEGLDLTGLMNYHYLYSNTSTYTALKTLRNYGVAAAYIGINDFFTHVQGKMNPSEVHEFIAAYLLNVFFPDFQKAILGGNMNISIADCVRFSAASSSFRLTPSQKLMIYGLQYFNIVGSGAQFIHQALQKPFNEALITYRGIKILSTGESQLETPICEITIRPSPFYFDPNDPLLNDDVHPVSPFAGTVLNPNGSWRASYPSTVHYLDDDRVVVEEHLGFTKEVAYNLFFVTSQSEGAVGSDIVTQVEAVGDILHIKKHGLNPLIKAYDYLTPIPAQQNDQDSKSQKVQAKNAAEVQKIVDGNRTLAQQLANVLKQWYVRYSEFITGTIVLRGTPNIKPGDILVYTTYDLVLEGGHLLTGRRTFVFYVESVTHEFVNFSHYITSVQVGRGIEVKM